MHYIPDGVHVCDEKIRTDKTTTYENLKMFCETVTNLFGQRFLRQPTQEDVYWLLAENKKKGFPGMLYSFDFMHWMWHENLYSWKG